MVVEEGISTGGLYGAVLEALARRRLFARVSSVALPAQAFVPHGEARAQRAQLGLDAEGLARAAEALG